MAKPKLKAFDKAVFDVIRAGVYRTEHIASKLHVDEAALKVRLGELAVAGLVVVDGEGVRLGIEGFNAYPAAKKRAKKTKENENSAIVQLKTEPAVASVEPAKTESIKPAPVALKPIEPEALPAPVTMSDLHELLKLGAPTGSARQPNAQKEEPPLVKTEARPLTKGGDEVCELCKGRFALAVKGKGHPKFGHCFCGAAYHKDCYEALINDTKKCVRCGRKLELYLDRRSEEAVHAIRGVFD
ncbi:MAG: hypothetical protein WC607_00500 [Candidatus Micrarchaeia archaeon]